MDSIYYHVGSLHYPIGGILTYLIDLMYYLVKTRYYLKAALSCNFYRLVASIYYLLLQGII